MKIRIGFVSNSSSTSFCLVGNKILSEERARELIKEGKTVSIIMEGYSGEGDPTIISKANIDIMDYFKKYKDVMDEKGSYAYIKTVSLSYDSYEDMIGPLKEKTEIMYGTCDQNSPEGLKEVKEYFAFEENNK